jgi:MMPL family
LRAGTGASSGALRELDCRLDYCPDERVSGIHATTSIPSWMPLMVFAFLFGLSMDYEVFILSRMREEYDRTGSTELAVIGGIGRTGRLVTCAALILFLAFTSMASAPDTDTKIAATGLAAGILIDAIVGCGGGTKSGTDTSAASADHASAPARQPGTPMPKLSAALIAQAGYGLTVANTNLGTVDEVFGSVPADGHVNPSAKKLNDQYARFGQCMGEHIRIHDVGHELALLVAYNRKDRAVQAAVEKASSVCEGLAITPTLATDSL